MVETATYRGELDGMDRDYNVGCQLVVFGTRWQHDLDGVLAEVADAGFTGVEASNLYAWHDRAAVRRSLARYGLVLCGVHCDFDEITDDTRLDAAIDFLRDNDARYLINSGVGAGHGRVQSYEAAAEVFNHIGRRCQEAGLTLCYHNHDWDFSAVDGIVPFHRLMELTDPAVVKIALDVYWVTFAGRDPLEFIATYGARIPYVHLKDLRDGMFAELGTGTIDFPSILHALRASAPVEWLINDQDRTALPTKEALDISARYLHQTLDV